MDSKKEAEVWDQYAIAALALVSESPQWVSDDSSASDFAIEIADKLLTARRERFRLTSSVGPAVDLDAPPPLSEEEVRRTRWECGWWLGEGFTCTGGLHRPMSPGGDAWICVSSSDPTLGVEIPFPEPMYFTGDRGVVLCAACAKVGCCLEPPSGPLARRPA